MDTEVRGRPFDVITIGDPCVDLVLNSADMTPQFGQVEKLVDDYHVDLGGSCTIFASQAAKLELRTAVLGFVGSDIFGQLIARRLAESGVDMRYMNIDPGLKTGLGLHLCQGDDRAMLTYLGSIDGVSPADVTDEFLRSARHLHLGSFFLLTRLRAHTPDIIRRAKSLGLTISLDTNWDPAAEWSGMAELLPLVDIFLPNEQETMHIANALGAHAANLTQAADHLLDAMRNAKRKRAPLVVVKQGKLGATAFGEERMEMGVAAPVASGDSIGAGDSFDAGFLAGWLRGLALERCLKIACACGRDVAEAMGGIQGQLRWREVVDVE